mmetsp:Transcript_80197/g.217208  ORF Transcript_80197/g.217208 Transcript_80197/m.217208 type:complete len:377 (-) Transcript_80197:258-1388(-)
MWPPRCGARRLPARPPWQPLRPARPLAPKAVVLATGAQPEGPALLAAGRTGSRRTASGEREFSDAAAHGKAHAELAHREVGRVPVERPVAGRLRRGEAHAQGRRAQEGGRELWGVGAEGGVAAAPGGRPLRRPHPRGDEAQAHLRVLAPLAVLELRRGAEVAVAALEALLAAARLPEPRARLAGAGPVQGRAVAGGLRRRLQAGRDRHDRAVGAPGPGGRPLGGTVDLRAGAGAELLGRAGRGGGLLVGLLAAGRRGRLAAEAHAAGPGRREARRQQRLLVPLASLRLRTTRGPRQARRRGGEPLGIPQARCRRAVLQARRSTAAHELDGDAADHLAQVLGRLVVEAAHVFSSEALVVLDAEGRGHVVHEPDAAGL